MTAATMPSRATPWRTGLLGTAVLGVLLAPPASAGRPPATDVSMYGTGVHTLVLARGAVASVVLDGGGGSSGACVPVHAGGSGARVQATVTAGRKTTLTVVVAGTAGLGSPGTGYGRGGGSTGMNGGTGGGASAVLVDGQLLLIAGGGGGGGCGQYSGGVGGDAGAGGGATPGGAAGGAAGDTGGAGGAGVSGGTAGTSSVGPDGGAGGGPIGGGGGGAGRVGGGGGGGIGGMLEPGVAFDTGGGGGGSSFGGDLPGADVTGLQVTLAGNGAQPATPDVQAVAGPGAAQVTVARR